MQKIESKFHIGIKPITLTKMGSKGEEAGCLIKILRIFLSLIQYADKRLKIVTKYFCARKNDINDIRGVGS